MAEKKAITEQYQNHLIQVGKSPHTVKAYGQDMTAFVRWFRQTSGDGFNPRVVDSIDIQEYKSYLTARGRAPATINRRLIALRGFFRWAKQEGLAEESPFEVIEKVLVKQQKDTAPRSAIPAL